MGDLGHLIQIIFPILTVIIGGACILQLSITTTLRASNADLRERVKDLEQIERRAAEKIAGQTAEIDALRRVVTGEVQLVAISDLLGQHHMEAVESWGDLAMTLKHTDKTMDAILAAIRAQGRQR